MGFIIGANLIKLAYWKIDYQNQLLHFSDQPFQLNTAYPVYTLPFDKPLLSGTPKIALKVAGETIENVLFDVGYNGGLILPNRFANLFSTDTTQIILDQSTSGIYGANTDTLTIKMLPLTVGGYQVELPVTFSTLDKALLGNDFLEHFMVYLNYDKKEIQLQLIESVQIDKAFSFIPNILNDSLWVVSRTTPNSPLQLGDTIFTINKYRPKDLFATHCAYVQGIRQLLNSDSLVVQLQNKELLYLHF